MLSDSLVWVTPFSLGVRADVHDKLMIFALSQLCSVIMRRSFLIFELQSALPLRLVTFRNKVASLCRTQNCARNTFRMFSLHEINSRVDIFAKVLEYY